MAPSKWCGRLVAAGPYDATIRSTMVTGDAAQPASAPAQREGPNPGEDQPPSIGAACFGDNLAVCQQRVFPLV